jgi:hypothetical protein
LPRWSSAAASEAGLPCSACERLASLLPDVPVLVGYVRQEAGQALEFRLRALDELRLLHQVAGRITAQSKFREDDQVGAALYAVSCVFHNPVYVPGKIANRRVDLGECDPHQWPVL